MPPKFSSNPKSASSSCLKIGVLMGGVSSERSISLKSGRAIAQALKNCGYDVLRIDPKQSDWKTKLNRVDAVFIALHGRGGEDGTVQAVLERKKVPYVGSGVKASRQAFDKVTAKRIFVLKGIPTPPYRILSTLKNWEKELRGFSGPVFIKPACEGSSIGAFAVEDLRGSAVKITRNLKRFGTLIAEKKIVGREFTVGLLDGKPLPVIELKPKAEFYSYKAKYTKGMTDYLVPAPISESLAARLNDLAGQVYRALGLRHFARIDFMVDDGGSPYVLEANTIPGFTEFSLLPKAAKTAGIPFDDLCRRLISLALTTGRRKMRRQSKELCYG